jgi:hypothetical protein
VAESPFFRRVNANSVFTAMFVFAAVGAQSFVWDMMPRLCLAFRASQNSNPLLL